jgi:pimeloyl-ACP methyl ester carboxylesterase
MIAIHDLGGVGEPLLVCHATGFCGHMYEPLARSLRTRHHVFAVDLRGQGDSPLWPGASLE